MKKMPPLMTPETLKAAQDKKEKTTRVRKVINEAGGRYKVAEELHKKYPNDVKYTTVGNWWQRGSIPFPYLLDVIAMTNRSPAYLRPDVYNVRHPGFKRYYKSAR
jgi:hypothetical protein